jgi:hypothetical protein
MYNKRNNNNKYQKSNYKKDAPFKQRKEDLTEIINRRNQRIKDFFNLCGISIRLLGNKNAPAMVVEDKYVLNCYVHNFELRFTDNPMQGNLIYTVKLTEKPNFDKNKVLSCISDYEKRVLTKIQLKNTKPILYLSGYNFLDKENKEGKYPVFSSYVPKIYFSDEKAKDVIEELSKDGYDLDRV